MPQGSGSVLAFLYNDIGRDGRAQRSCARLAAAFDVTVVAYGRGVPPETAYRVRSLSGRRSGVFSYARFTIRCLAEAVVAKPSILYAHDYFAALPAILAARVLAVPFVYDAHEFVGDWMFSRGRDRLFALLDGHAHREAQLVVVASEARASLTRAWYPQCGRIITVSNGLVDRGQPHPSDQRPPIIVYQGSIAVSRRLERFLKAAAYLPKGYQMLMIGAGPDLADLRRRYSARSSAGNVAFLGPVDREALPALLRGCSVGIVSYSSSGLNDWFCAPNKLHEYAVAGLPSACSDNPALAEAVTKYGIGSVIQNGMSAAEIAEELVRMVENRERYQEGLVQFLEDSSTHLELDELARAVGSVSMTAPKATP